MTKLHDLLVAGALSVVGPQAASAASFVAQPFAQSVKSAPIIVAGAISWNSSSHMVDNTPFTDNTLIVTEQIKGSVNGPTIQISELGGYNMIVSGAAHFKDGENVVVFLNGPDFNGRYKIYGMAMGKMSVDPTTGILSGGAIASDEVAAARAHAIKGAPTAPTVPPRRRSITDLREIVANPNAFAPKP
jgi:hypothetical protein